MEMRPSFKKFANRLESFDMWDDEYDSASIPKRLFILLVRFIRITFREFLEDHLLLKGMALTFGTILSLVPFLVISFSVFKLFGGSSWFTEVVQPIILENLAPGSGPAVTQKLHEVIERAGSATLGGIGVIVLLLAVYGIFAGIESIFNSIWGIRVKYRGLKRLPLYWGMVTIIPILVVGSFALTTYIQALPLFSQVVERMSFARNLFNQAVPWLMVVLGFFLLYRFLPGEKVRNRDALTGALVAGVLHELVKMGFIFYTETLVRYDVVYGSLAIIPLLLVWINLSWFVVLLGVEVSFVTHHFSILVTKGKDIPFSRLQKDSLAYLVLLETTLAFRGKRKTVIIDEWSHDFGVPLGVASEVVEKLCHGGILRRSGISNEEIILLRDPDNIRMQEVESILSGESGTQWPETARWSWMKKMTDKKWNASLEATGSETLGEFLGRLEEVSD
jgi:membrane protein